MTSEGLRSGPRPSVDRELTLLERIAGGDRAAVPLLLDRYGGLVWSIARRQVGVESAEDLVQEVFLQLWKTADRYDPERASEATWITTIARRRAIDLRRRVGRRPDEVALPEESAAEDDALERVELADEARLAAEALEQLRPEQREVLRLAIIEGLTHTQIAERTKLPLGTVKSHARRGLERVRALLAERGPGGEDGP